MGAELVSVNAMQDTANTYPVGSIATYQCSDGYTPGPGNALATCTENGIWEGLIINCMRGES